MTTRSMSRAALSLLVASALFVPVLAAGDAEEGGEAATLAEALKNGTFAAGLRYRVERVADDAPAVRGRDAGASTLRSTVSFRTQTLYGFGGFVEFENVADLGLQDRHKNAGAGSLSNGVSDRPVIADPAGTEVNQAYLSFHSIPNTTIRAGRQTIAFGTERFVGPVGWRQNHQTFDAVRVSFEGIPRTTVEYALLDNINRIFGDNRELTGHLVNLAVKAGEHGTLTPYYYRLDFDKFAALSTSTGGARWRGRVKLGEDWSLPYHLEAASQSETGDNPNTIDVGYARFEVGASRGTVRVIVGQELLEGESGKGRFQTPLATLHKFNGFADKFLTTPANGLQDRFVTVGGKWGRASAVVTFHDFTSDTMNIDYGTEVDFVVTFKTKWKQGFGLKVANYDAAQHAFDTAKAMLWTTYAF